jgi:membrane protein YdbS with pleckstrin-like domain
VTPSPAQVETETPSLNLVPPHLSKGTITAIFVTGVVSVLILLIVAATNRSNRKRITSKFSSAISQVTGSSGLPPEETLWIGCPSQWNYLWSWVFGLLLLVVGAGFIMIMGIIIDRARRVYIVTNRRVIFQYGLFAKSTNEIRIKDIRSINVAKSGISGLIGVGNVEFSSAAKDRAEVIFAGISEADVIRDMVGKLQADA